MIARAFLFFVGLFKKFLVGGGVVGDMLGGAARKIRTDHIQNAA